MTKPDAQAARDLIEEAQQWARAGQGRMVHALADELTRWVDASEDPESCAEREVGRYVYERVSSLMDAKAGTRDGEELTYLAQLVTDVEEYGAKGSDGQLPWPSSGPGDQRAGWQDIRTAPKDGTALKIRTYIVVRWLAYKPDGARQMKRAGRWQAHDGHGWTNCADPTDVWQYADPRDEPPQAARQGEGEP